MTQHIQAYILCTYVENMFYLQLIMTDKTNIHSILYVMEHTNHRTSNIGLTNLFDRYLHCDSITRILILKVLKYVYINHVD